MAAVLLIIVVIVVIVLVRSSHRVEDPVIRKLLRSLTSDEKAMFYRVMAQSGPVEALVAVADDIAENKRRARAIPFYETAAERGSRTAEYKLGSFCKEEKKWKEAMHWLSLATSHGDFYAALDKGSLYLESDGPYYDPASACDIFRGVAALCGIAVCEKGLLAAIQLFSIYLDMNGQHYGLYDAKQGIWWGYYALFCAEQCARLLSSNEYWDSFLSRAHRELESAPSSVFSQEEYQRCKETFQTRMQVVPETPYLGKAG